MIFNFTYFTEMLTELLRREKEAKIKPDPDIDAYMKVRNRIEKEVYYLMFLMPNTLSYYDFRGNVCLI